MPRPSYETLVAAFARLIGFLREIVAQGLGIPGRLRFRIMRETDRADAVVKRATDAPPKNGG